MISQISIAVNVFPSILLVVLVKCLFNSAASARMVIGVGLRVPWIVAHTMFFW